MPKCQKIERGGLDQCGPEPVFALSGIALRNAAQIDPLATQNATCVAPMCDTKKTTGCLTKTLNVTADGNGLKMQSSVHPF